MATNIGHKMSRNIGAARSTPSDVRGASGLAANPIAKCPMNMRASYQQDFKVPTRGRVLDAATTPSGSPRAMPIA
jgi:hypothetical protein